MVLSTMVVGREKRKFCHVFGAVWHADIEDFLELRKNHGDEEMRARDLFYALWIPDLFMKMVENDDYWYLMCPNKCQGLSDCYGEEFNEKYTKYVEEENTKRR